MTNHHAAGIFMILVGIIFLLGGRILSFLPVIQYQGKHISFYFPIGLCLLASVVFTLIMHFIKR